MLEKIKNILKTKHLILKNAWRHNKVPMLGGAFFMLMVFVFGGGKEDGVETRNFNDDLLLKKGRIIETGGNYGDRKREMIEAKYKSLQNVVLQLKDDLATLKGSTGLKRLNSIKGSAQVKDSVKTDKVKTDSVNQKQSAVSKVGRLTKKIKTKKRKVNRIARFPVKFSVKDEKFIRIPSATHIKGTLIAGGEVAQLGKGKKGLRTPMLIQLDYGAILANQHKLIDLAGCYMLGKSNGNRSSARVAINVIKVTCVSSTGIIVEKEINGYVAGSDDNFGVQGVIDDFNRNRKVSLAFLATAAGSIADIIKQAGMVQNISPLGGLTQQLKTSQLTKTVAAGGASNSLNLVAEWYMAEAKDHLPQIKVNSGQKLTVILTNGFDMPKDYFRGSKNDKNFDANNIY